MINPKIPNPVKLTPSLTPSLTLRVTYLLPSDLEATNPTQELPQKRCVITADLDRVGLRSLSRDS